MNRKRDRLPSCEMRWRGTQTLSLMAENVHIARKLTHFVDNERSVQGCISINLGTIIVILAQQAHWISHN